MTKDYNEQINRQTKQICNITQKQFKIKSKICETEVVPWYLVPWVVPILIKIFSFPFCTLFVPSHKAILLSDWVSEVLRGASLLSIVNLTRDFPRCPRSNDPFYIVTYYGSLLLGHTVSTLRKKTWENG